MIYRQIPKVSPSEYNISPPNPKRKNDSYNKPLQI